MRMSVTGQPRTQTPRWMRIRQRVVLADSFKTESELPPNTDLSDIISKDMRKRGFKFVGSTIIYAFIQGIGMVNDHTTDCFRYSEIKSTYKKK